MIRALTIAALAAGLGVVVGCKSHDSNDVSLRAIRSDPTPALHHVAMTEEQANNRRAMLIDNTLRQIWDDLEMIMLTDEPLRLTPNPIY